MRQIQILVTEGYLEIPVALRILSWMQVATSETMIRPSGGRLGFWSSAERYNRAAAFRGPILAIADLETHPCPSGLIASHLHRPRNPDFILRVAERMVESWLLADADAMAQFLGISPALIPLAPESEMHPKRTLVNLARRSRRRIRKELVPPPGSKGLVGPGYTAVLSAFARDQWRPDRAASRSESLRRAVAAIRAAVVLDGASPA